MTLDRITVAQLEAAQFDGHRFLAPGYDEDQVDQLLDRCAGTIAVDQRARDEIRTVCKTTARRGKTVGERELAVTVLGILSELHEAAPEREAS